MLPPVGKPESHSSVSHMSNLSCWLWCCFTLLHHVVNSSGIADRLLLQVAVGSRGGPRLVEQCAANGVFRQLHSPGQQVLHAGWAVLFRRIWCGTAMWTDFWHSGVHCTPSREALYMRHPARVFLWRGHAVECPTVSICCRNFHLRCPPVCTCVCNHVRWWHRNDIWVDTCLNRQIFRVVILKDSMLCA